MLTRISTLTLSVLLARESAIASAFSLSSKNALQHQVSSTSLHATIEGTALKAPSDIPMDDIPGLFETYVQKTYG